MTAPGRPADGAIEAAGVVLYPKPPGPTSHDVVTRVRRRLRERAGGARLKVGHAGTLDPFASGLLLVLVGRATRVQRFLMALPKTYRAVARLGWTSDTGDRDGRLSETGRVPERIEVPVGRFLQRPPAYSAVKVEGEPLYRRARRGEAVEGEPRPVTVHRAELLWRDGDRAAIEVECSAGTYVRQLVAGLGDAYCEELERLAIGPFRLDDADAERLVPLAEALAFLPERALEPDEAERVRHGVAVALGRRPTVDGGQGVARPALGRQLTVDSGPAVARLALGRRSTVDGRPGVARPGQVKGEPRSPAAGEAGAPSTVDPDEAGVGAVRLTHAGRLVAIAEPREDVLKPVVVLDP